MWNLLLLLLTYYRYFYIFNRFHQEKILINIYKKIKCKQFIQFQMPINCNQSKYFENVIFKRNKKVCNGE